LGDVFKDKLAGLKRGASEPPPPPAEDSDSN
jgi:hypothetical protein